jgi:hypothetical protein
LPRRAPSSNVRSYTPLCLSLSRIKFQNLLVNAKTFFHTYEAINNARNYVQNHIREETQKGGSFACFEKLFLFSSCAYRRSLSSEWRLRSRHGECDPILPGPLLTLEGLPPERFPSLLGVSGRKPWPCSNPLPITDAKIQKVFHARLCPFSICEKTISHKGAKVALDSRNDDQSPVDKLVTSR